jgi:hypothetical protein
MVTIPNPNDLGLATMPTTNDMSLAKANNVSLVLPRFQPLWWLENQDLCSFDLKTCFATRFDLKHFRNHDKLINGLKKTKTPPQKLNSTRN